MHTINIIPKNFIDIMKTKFVIEEHLKTMSNQIIHVRLKKTDTQPWTMDNCGDLHLIDLRGYNGKLGIINVDNQII